MLLPIILVCIPGCGQSKSGNSPASNLKVQYPVEVEEGYGYGWWVRQDTDGFSGYMAQGYAGQMILIVPEHSLVISITHNWRVNSQKAIEQQAMAFSRLTRLALEEVLKK